MKIRFRNILILFLLVTILYIGCIYISYIRVLLLIIQLQTYEEKHEQIKYFGKIVTCDKDIPLSKLNPKTNIFFIRTSGSQKTNEKQFHIGSRQACAIESAARQNPKQNIFVLLVDTDDLDANNGLEQILTSTVLSHYSNIYFICTTLDEVARDTIAYNWLKTGKIMDTWFVVNNIADVIRLLVLFKYGGTYMDTDIISMQNIDIFGNNFAAAEASDSINNALMNFDNNSIGKKFVTEMILDVINNYNGYVWAQQGPRLITKMFIKYCSIKDVKKMERDFCKGLNVISQEQVYAIPWYQRHIFFNENELERGRDMLKNSTITHLWNSMTKHIKVDKSRDILLNEIGRNYCPEIFNIKEISEW